MSSSRRIARPSKWPKRSSRRPRAQAVSRDQRVLILVGPQKNPLIRAIRATLALSSPINWSPTGPTEPSPPTWAKDSALQPPLSNYSVVGLEVGRPGATAAFLEKHKVTLPAGDDVTLAALDLDGNVVGQISGRKLLSEKQPSVQPLISWLHAQAQKMVDAEKLLAEAHPAGQSREQADLLREDVRPGRRLRCPAQPLRGAVQGAFGKGLRLPQDRRPLS